MYIVLSTTSGAASCPRVTPVEKLQASWSCPAFWAVIWVSPLYLVEAKLRAGMIHCPSSFTGEEVSELLRAARVLVCSPAFLAGVSFDRGEQPTTGSSRNVPRMLHRLVSVTCA